MTDLKLDSWEKSYSRKENFIFYPKEEVVKFLNRFVKKKGGVDSFQSHLGEEQKLKALDLGCGIGRQTILFEEFGIEAYGVDISSNALQQAKELAHSFGYDLSERLILLREVELPFEDNFFDIAISDSVLDSMAFEYALKYMQELNRTVKKLVYLNLISADATSDYSAKDIVVEGDHEKGTIQSYYDETRIEKLIFNTDFRIKHLSKITIENLLNGTSGARFHVVLEKKV